MGNALIVIGDPELDDPIHRAVLRGRFTTLMRHAIASWKLDCIYHAATPLGPERWLSEMGEVGTIAVPMRAFPKRTWEFCYVRNTRLVNEVQQEKNKGARVLGMYFRGPLKGTKSTEDLANKLSEIGVRVILLPWCPSVERGRSSADAIQASGDENQQAHSA